MCVCVCTVGVGIRMWAGSYNLNKVTRDGLIQKVTCQQSPAVGERLSSAAIKGRCCTGHSKCKCPGFSSADSGITRVERVEKGIRGQGEGLCLMPQVSFSRPFLVAVPGCKLEPWSSGSQLGQIAGDPFSCLWASLLEPHL